MEEKLKFPIEGATACPLCGCEERIGQEFIQELKKDGKLSSKAFPKEALMLQVPLMDLTHPPLTTTLNVPVLQIYFDVCKECHHIYCTGVGLVQQPVQIQQSMKQFGFPQQDSRWS